MTIEDAARRRDFTINAIVLRSADRRVSRSVRRTRGPASGGSCGRSIARTFGDDSLRVLRAVQFAARFECELDQETRALCASIPLDDLPAERIWGEIEKLLLQAPTAVDRPAARARSRRHPAALPGAGGARRLPAGARVASRGRRLGAHADGRGPGAHAHRRPRSSAEGDGDARRRLPRSRQAADDGVHRRPDPIDGSRAGRRRAGHAAARSAQRAFAGRLRRPQPGARHRRAPSEAAGVLQVSDAGRRRRLPAARAESGPRAAGARRRIGLPRPHRQLRLQRHRLVPRAGARTRRGARPAAARCSWAATCSSSACRPGRGWARSFSRSTNSNSTAASRRSTTRIAAARDILAAGAVTQETNDW